MGPGQVLSILQPINYMLMIIHMAIDDLAVSDKTLNPCIMVAMKAHCCLSVVSQ
jgi:hypothetical protein